MEFTKAADVIQRLCPVGVEKYTIRSNLQSGMGLVAMMEKLKVNKKESQYDETGFIV
jgi:hypothetical protein